MATTKSVTKTNILPKAIAALPQVWQAVYAELPTMASYQDMVARGWFKTSKSASTVMGSDPDAPRPVYIGKHCFFDRQELVVWACRKSCNAKKRGPQHGRKPAV